MSSSRSGRRPTWSAEGGVRTSTSTLDASQSSRRPACNRHVPRAGRPGYPSVKCLHPFHGRAPAHLGNPVDRRLENVTSFTLHVILKRHGLIPRTRGDRSLQPPCPIQTSASGGLSGRALLIGAVVFWWGAVVVPQLISFMFRRAPMEGPSAATQSGYRGLARKRGVRRLFGGRRIPGAPEYVSQPQVACRPENWITVGGWAVLAVTAAYLAWEEVSEFHVARTLELGTKCSAWPTTSISGLFWRAH